ncbi:MAG: FesM [Chloroflexi bacterium]|nr:FesM [Chloroflexota bacterium]
MTTHRRISDPIYQPPPGIDLLHAPLLGRVLRWRWGRLLYQTLLLILTLLIIYDGLTGPQLAPENIATVTAWIHYRGLVMLALLLVGNLFCMGCPFTLPRTLARRLSGSGRRWPRALRNKWLAILLLFLIFFLYEWLDLWASPWLTAWLAIVYFAASFVLEALFAESPFCKYLCPLGSFNFVGATISPTQITTRSQEICRTCIDKECVNDSTDVLGCGTELFVPRLQSNLDCIFCLDCARACPHDNVALAARFPLRELSQGVWPQRWDVAFLALLFVGASLANAFGMVPPVYELQAGLMSWLPMLGNGLSLLFIFGFLELLLPATLGLSAAWLSQRLSGTDDSLRLVFTRYVPALVPLGFTIWLAHYGFHFATGALTIIPVFQNFLIDHGILMLGVPDWSLAAILPFRWLLPLEMLAIGIGFMGSLYVLNERASATHTRQSDMIKALLPWIILALALALAAIYLFSMPMEMRGTVGFGH